jgi:WD40 repeat protein
VTCVVFGPSAGLTYHKLAVAVGARIYIYHLHVNVEENEAATGGTRTHGESEFVTKLAGDFFVCKINSVKKLGVLEEANSLVTRISWNILGDVITAVYADGLVRLWKYAFTNKWTLLSVIDPPVEMELGNKDDVYY